MTEDQRPFRVEATFHHDPTMSYVSLFEVVAVISSAERVLWARPPAPFDVPTTITEVSPKQALSIVEYLRKVKRGHDDERLARVADFFGAVANDTHNAVLIG